MELNDKIWRNCSSCKKSINYTSRYYECNVSTCTGRRTGYVFCSVPCWETHLPQARHRDAWAIEKQSPSFAQYQQELKAESGGSETPAPRNADTAGGQLAGSGRRLMVKPGASSALSQAQAHEVLVVVSKMKQYVKDRADMNTSADVSDVLSNLLRRACDDAIDRARADGRKTLMARDFKD